MKHMHQIRMALCLLFLVTKFTGPGCNDSSEQPAPGQPPPTLPETNLAPSETGTAPATPPSARELTLKIVGPGTRGATPPEPDDLLLVIPDEHVDAHIGRPTRHSTSLMDQRTIKLVEELAGFKLSSRLRKPGASVLIFSVNEAVKVGIGCSSGDCIECLFAECTDPPPPRKPKRTRAFLLVPGDAIDIPMPGKDIPMPGKENPEAGTK
jgi:hypothetical protein